MILELERHTKNLESVFIDGVKYIEMWAPRKYKDREDVVESEYEPTYLFIADHCSPEKNWIGADIRFNNDKSMMIIFDTILYIRSNQGDLIRKYVANLSN